MAISTRRLAQLAGVSPMTASRAVRGREGVSDELRRKIVALARKHGFPMPPIRAAERTELLQVMATLIHIEISDDLSEQAFNQRLLAGLRLGAVECGVELAHFTPADNVWPLVVDRRQVDGVVLVHGDEFMPHPAFPPPVPAIFIFNGPEGADVVTVDNFDAARRLGLHLADLGHRHVAYIGPETDMSRKRLAGLRTGLETAGGVVAPEAVHIRRSVGGRAATLALTDGLLEKVRPGVCGPGGFTALMAYNDYMAAAAILRLRERGVRVPEDVSVVGFDHVRLPWYRGPALTSAAMPLEDIGAEAARFLYWRLAHPTAPRRQLVLPASFVPGNTTT